MHFNADKLYHIYNRSNETVFYNQKNYLFFLSKVKKAQYEYQDRLNRIDTFVEKIIFEYKDARSSKLLYRDGLLIKGKQALEISYSAYESGKIDFTGLLDVQRQYLNFELEYETALSKQAKKEAELKYLIGNQ